MENSTLHEQRPLESDELDGPLAEIRQSFDGRPDELIPMLQTVQRALGYLPEQALEEIARMTGVTTATVYGVATFYSQFRLQPVGRNIVKVCRGTACHVRGSGRILKDIEAQLQVAPGDTTSDRQFTLETVACFGSCALAPVMVVNDSVHGRMDTGTSSRMLEELAAEPPSEDDE